MTMTRIPVLSAACITLTCLSLATLGSRSAAAESVGGKVRIEDAGKASRSASNAATRRPTTPTSLPSLGPSPVTAGSGSEFEGGLPVLTRSGIRSLRVGDPLSLPTPDGDVIRFTVETKGFTDSDASETYLSSGGRETTYGIIVQRGEHLAGFLQRVDGRAYRLMPGADGTYRLDRVQSHGERECGVGRVDLPGTDSPENRSPSDGVAGGPGVSPCPPEVLPFSVPVTLRKDSGLIIDVLFVFTQAAADLAAVQGRDIRTLAQLSVSQANLAMRRSTEQGVAGFDGQEANQGGFPLNGTCGYSEGGFPNGTGPDCHYFQNPPDNGPPTGMAGQCKEDDSDPPKRTVHITLPAVSPAEQDTCLPRIRLVAALVADGFFGQEPPYNGTGLPIDLSRVSTPGDGYMDYVPVWRDALGADAVCLVGLNYGADSGFVGLAYVMNDINDPAQGAFFPLGPLYPRVPLTAVGNPYPLVDLTKAPDPSTPFLNDPLDPGSIGTWGTPVIPTVSTLQEFQESPYSLLDYTTIDDLVYAHELGHNMGCQHNHDNGSQTRDALFPDSFGYRTAGGGGGDGTGFKTVMSYGNQTRLPGYSNPNATWRQFAGNNPDVPDEAAGIEFDFVCTELDGDGTDVQYRPGRGFNVISCGPPVQPDEVCEDPTDTNRGTADSSPMVLATDVEVQQQFNTDQTGGANNARSISQTKFDFAKFRCSVFPVVDCNDDEVDDFVQAVDGLLADCNGNGVPDECETVQNPGSSSPTDCNGNGVPDQCDINSGDSFDDNANLIPDECEDQTALFSETFERIPFGLVEGALPIAKVSDEALKELRKLDPDFPDYFATIETVGLAQAPGNGGYVYFNVQPSAFQYRLGGNGERRCPDFVDPQVSATQGFATAIGARGYGQALNFDSATGDFPSQAGITTITMARDCKEVRLFLNAADFTGYFDYFPPLPLLGNYPYLRENLIFISAFNEAGELVYEQSLDVRNEWRPREAFCSEVPNPQGMVFLRVGAPLGSGIELDIRRVEIRGAFVVMDNIAFDAGLDNSAIPCVADIAGGPFDPIGTPTPDGRVGGEDLLVVLATYGYGNVGNPQFSTCPPDDPASGEELARLADINEDCVVDGMDLLEVLAAWGQCLGGTP